MANANKLERDVYVKERGKFAISGLKVMFHHT